MTTKAATVPKKQKAATPWGPATVLEELRVSQRAGDRRFDTVVQLLEDEKGVSSSASPTHPAVGPAAARSRYAEGTSSACARRSSRGHG